MIYISYEISRKPHDFLNSIRSLNHIFEITAVYISELHRHFILRQEQISSGTDPLFSMFKAEVLYLRQINQVKIQIYFSHNTL